MPSAIRYRASSPLLSPSSCRGPGERHGSRRTLASNVEQGETGFGIFALAQITRRLDQDDFEGRPDICFDQVTTDYAAVGFAENRVQMQARALVADRHIAEQR